MKQITITAICVHAQCADGKIRKVRLRPGHAHKLHNWIRIASGGRVHLYDVPVAIVAAEPKKSLADKVRDCFRPKKNLRESADNK